MSTTDQKIDELAQMVGRGFSEIRGEMAQGFSEVRGEMVEMKTELKGDIAQLRHDVDVMLDRHIGTFRKDYDDLAMRVKKLEELVLKH